MNTITLPFSDINTEINAPKWFIHLSAERDNLRLEVGHYSAITGKESYFFFGSDAILFF